MKLVSIYGCSGCGEIREKQDLYGTGRNGEHDFFAELDGIPSGINIETLQIAVLIKLAHGYYKLGAG